MSFEMHLLSLISPEQSTKVKNYIIDILSSLVQNGESLPQEVVDIVFSNIVRQEPEVDGSKTTRGAAYAFTVEFIRRTSSHIEPYIHLVSGCIGGGLSYSLKSMKIKP